FGIMSVSESSRSSRMMRLRRGCWAYATGTPGAGRALYSSGDGDEGAIETMALFYHPTGAPQSAWSAGATWKMLASIVKEGTRQSLSRQAAVAARRRTTA